MIRKLDKTYKTIIIKKHTLKAHKKMHNAWEKRALQYLGFYLETVFGSRRTEEQSKQNIRVFKFVVDETKIWV